MSSSYSTTKILNPNTRKQAIRVVSSKARPLHTPGRVRFRRASKLSEESGKEIMKATITENSSATVKIKGVHLEKNLSLFERNHLKLNHPSGASTKDSAKRRPSRARRTPTVGSMKKEKPQGIYSEFNGPDIRKPVLKKGSGTRSQAAMSVEPERQSGFRVERVKLISPVKISDQIVSLSSGTYGKLNAATSAEAKRRSGFHVDRKKPTSAVKKSCQKVTPAPITSNATHSKPVLIQSGMTSCRAKTVNYHNNDRGKFVRTVSKAPQSRPSQPVATEGLVRNSRPLSGTKPVSPRGHYILHTALLKFFDDKVSLTQGEINKNSSTVNGFLESLLPLIQQQDELFGLKKLNTGSYYEKLRVSQPNEFDTMLVFDSHRITKFFNIEYNFRNPSTMLFAKLLFKDHVLKGRELWGAFLTADGKYLSPTKLLGHFFSSVRKAVKLLARDQRHRVSTNVRQNGPAVTLKIDEKIEFDLVLSIEILEWPRCASGWGNFSSKSSWPSKHQVEEIRISQPKCYLVAKPCDAERSLDSRVFWRISFSEAEKKLLLPSDSDKKYFKIVKAIFQAKKEELKPLTSFHLKNAFLLHRCEKPDKSDLARSVLEFIQNLIQRMRKGLLPHFFVSRVNLLATISQDDRLKIARRLENYLVHLVKRPNCFLPSLNP